MAGLAVDAVARRAGVSRATIYRWFPGGKDELLAETVAWEQSRFVDRVRAQLPDGADLGEQLVAVILATSAEVAGHRVLQQELASEPELLLPFLMGEGQWMAELVGNLLRPALDRAPLRADLSVPEAADHLARMLLSVVQAPGRWDLTEPTSVARFVTDHLLPSVI